MPRSLSHQFMHAYTHTVFHEVHVYFDKTSEVPRIWVIARYNDALVSLIKSILQKLQFKHNQSQLDELDDDSLDDDVSN